MARNAPMKKIIKCPGSSQSMHGYILTCSFVSSGFSTEGTLISASAGSQSAVSSDIHHMGYCAHIHSLKSDRKLHSLACSIVNVYKKLWV